jgi:integral membrane protein
MFSALNMVRGISIAEAVSYLVLLGIAMPLKYLAGQPMAVRIAGSLHGLLFILLCLAVWRARRVLGWSTKQCAQVMLVALVPVVPFYFDKTLKKWDKAAG